MKLIVGLGNPGEEYEQTRHNAGFMVVEAMATSSWLDSKTGLCRYSWIGDEVELLKPQTYMNKSGDAVAYAMKKHALKPEDVYVIHDDLDIALGKYKIQFGKGPKVHNGVNSVISGIKSDGFWRVRVGVENRDGEHIIPGKKYLLERFGKEEREKFDQVIVKIVEELRRVF